MYILYYNHRTVYILFENAYTVLTQYLHSTYTVLTQYLHSTYTVLTQYLHSTYTVLTQYLHSTYTVLKPLSHLSESIIPFINRSEILLIRTRSERNVQKPARNENTPIIIRSYSGSNKLLFRLQSVYIQNLSDHHRTCQTLKNSLISRPTAFRTFRLYSVRLRLQRICTELFTERLPVKSDAIPDYSACIPNYSDRILSVFRPFRLCSEHVPVAHQTATLPICYSPWFGCRVRLNRGRSRRLSPNLGNEPSIVLRLL